MTVTAIVGGTVIDGTGGDPIEDAIVLIDRGRILNVHRRSEIGLPDETAIIDATGMWVVPGLIDAHTHAATLADNSWIKADDPLALTDRFMKLAIEYGVTTLRDTGDFDPDRVLKLMRAGRPDWPRFYGAGPILDGPAPRHQHWYEVLETEQEARAAVHRLAGLGVDFFKVHVWMSRDVMAALISEAHALNLPVTGHLGHVVTVEEAVRLGIDSLEHIRMGPELLSEDGRRQLSALPERERDYSMSCKPWRFIDPASEAVRRLIDLLAERHVFLTPTLHFHREILHGDDPVVANPPDLRLMPGEAVNTWKSHRFYDDYTSEDFRWAKVEYARQLEFVARAHEAGVRVTAGTDVSVLPGTSLHTELRLLVDAGLSPMDALVSCTQRAAEQLALEQEVGTLTKRRRADAVVLAKDPLEEIGNTRSVVLTMKGGEIVHRREPPLSETR